MIIFASFPLGIVLPSQIFFICSLTDSGDEPSLRTVLPDAKPQGLLCAKVLLPVGVEDGQGDAIEGILDVQQVPSLKRGKLGYLWLAGCNFS